MVTRNGILKGNGLGGVSVATAGTDYQEPLTAGTDYTTPADLASEIVKVSIASFSSLPKTVSNAAIKSGHEVVGYYMSNQNAMAGAWTWTGCGIGCWPRKSGSLPPNSS